MALPASDTFNRANESPVATASSGFTWTTQFSAFRVVTNQATPSAFSVGGDNNAGFDGTDTYGNDQYAQCTLVRVFDGGPSVRHSGTGIGARNFYFLDGKTAASNIQKCVNDTFTNLGSTPSQYANGDVAKLQVVGTTLSAFKNGAANGSVSDGALASGKAGQFEFANNSGTAGIHDDWSADNVTNDTQEWRGCYPPRQAFRFQPSVTY